MVLPFFLKEKRMTTINNTIRVNFVGPNRGVIKTLPFDHDDPNGPKSPAQAQRRPRPVNRKRDLKVIGKIAA